jgi:hypothetical protein
MRYVKANSLMPVPEIYFYDTTCNNPIGASFIVMEFLEGVPIPYSDIDSENIEQTTKIYKQICLTAYQLLSVRFDQIGGVYMDSSTGVVIGPKFGSDGKAYGPINTTDEYYKTLVNEYWKSAVSSLGANYEVPENWNWKTATQFEREVFTAYLHLQCHSRLDISQLNNTFCLQHHDFHLRNFLVDKELNIVGVIDWDESSTIPVLGFDPLSFCPNRKSDRERCLKYLAEIEIEQPSGTQVLSELYHSKTAEICRLLETSLMPYRIFSAREIFEFLYQVDWEDGEELKKECFKNAIHAAKMRPKQE